MQYVTNFFAQAYGACNYGTSSYQNSSCATTAASGGSSSGGVLTNTGFDIALIVTVACIIALAAVLVRFWKRPAKPSSAAK
jgi:hypothetical protein